MYRRSRRFQLDPNGKMYDFPCDDESRLVEIGLEISIREHEEEEYNDTHGFKETRIYVSEASETLEENILKRFSGIEPNPTWYKKFILPRVLRAAGISSDVRVRWSRKAGCSMCPCSPGFIVVGERLGRDIYVEYELEPTEAMYARMEEEDRKDRQEMHEQDALEYVEEGAG